MLNDRARGALLGLAVGDALGTTFEFEHLEQPAYPALATGPATDVVGAGPFDLVAGQVTDDTQLAVCLARSLVAMRRLDADDLARRYVAWSTHAFDIGNQTGAAIRRLELGEPAATAGLVVWRASERRPAGNGSLMRTAPIGVALAGRGCGTDAVVAAAIADSLITHADPRCLLACAAFDAAIAAAVTSPQSGEGLVAAARAGLDVAVAQLRAAWTDPDDVTHLEAAAEAVAGDLTAAGAADPGVYAPAHHLQRSPGFVRVAFRLAFWHAVHTRSWRDAVVDIASRGGDADTNTAIAGALLGARDGDAAIPAAWCERVLAVAQPGPAAWADDHHPRHLLALLAR
jgi:ADP-ribosylglycohydrolase